MHEDRKTLMVVDSNALIHRAYHALPGLVDPKGVLVNAVYGFCLIFLKAISEINPDYIVATFDVKGETFRHKEFEEYKAQRKKNPDNFYDQIPMIKDFLSRFGVTILEKQGFEADDLIGTVCEKFKAEDINIIIVSGDLDTLQLLTDKVNVWTLKKGISNSSVYNIKAFEDRYGIRVDQFVDFKALKGDPSDNIPGVKGVGEKRAIDILKQYDSLDNLYHNIDKYIEESKDNKDKKILNILKENEDEAMFSKHLSLIKKDVDVELNLEDTKFDFNKKGNVLKFLQEKGFNSLISKLNLSEFNKSTKKDLKDDVEIKECNSEKDFFDNFDKNSKVFLFDDRDLNIEKDGLTCFFNKDDLWYIYLGDDINFELFGDCKIHTYDSKKMYHKYFDKLKNIRFYDLKLAFWLIDPDRKDYSIESLIKKFNVKNNKAISFIQNYEIEDWIKLFNNILGVIHSKIINSKLNTVLEEIESGLTLVLAKMEKRGICLNTRELKKIKDKIYLEILNLEEEIFELTKSEFNINSPKQLSEVLFEKLKLPTKGLAKTTTKNISTNSNELEKLIYLHPCISKILKFKELKKLETSFLKTLPNFIDENGRIHTTFVQTGTATGRLSSDTPNLQNIPSKSDYGKLVRGCFEAGKGFDFVSFDYSQMELRIAAKLSGDKLMLKAFEEGKDFHRYTASLVNKVDYTDVTKEQRNRAKALNFGIVYGMGSKAFAQSAGISKEEARMFIEEYYENYFGLRNFLDDLKLKAKENGYCETLYGRKRYLSFVGGFGFQAALEERIAVNMPIQGLAADIIKKAMIKIDNYLIENELEDKVRMILQIHDELIFEIDCDINSDEIIENIKKLMEENDFDILLKVDIKKGKNWGDLKAN